MKAVATLTDAAGKPLSGRLQIVLLREDGQKAIYLSGAVENGQLSAEVAADPFAEVGARAAATLATADSARLADSSRLNDSAAASDAVALLDAALQVAAPSTRKTYSLSELVSGAGAQVGAASSSVSGSGVALGEVKLTIRGVATPTEAGAVGLTLDETNRDAAVLSEVSTRYVPGAGATTGATTAETAGPTAPDLRGYTRQMAARKVAGLGLQASFATLSVPADSPDLGRVVRQSPPPGAPTAPGATLRLFLGA